MTNDEREQFLADVHVGVLAVAHDSGAPLAIPVWYRYRPGGVVEISTSASSVKVNVSASHRTGSTVRPTRSAPVRVRHRGWAGQLR